MGGKVVEERRRLVEEQRQVILDAGRCDAAADVLVDAGPARIAFDAIAPAPPERLARGLVDRELAARQQPHLRHRIQPALRVRVEGANGLELGIEQIEPVGQGRAHREEVDQPAPDRELTRCDHLRDVLVSREHQLGTQLLGIDGLTLAEEEGVTGDVLRRREAVQRRGRRHDQHVDRARSLAQAEQGFESVGDQVLVRRQRVVGQRFPVGQGPHRKRRLEVGDLVDQALRIECVGRHHDERALLGAGLHGSLCQQKGVG